MKSIKQVSEQVETDLQRYIESDYHLRNERLLEERKALMEEEEISTEPWVEGSPSFEFGDEFKDLDLPHPMVDLLQDLKEDSVSIYDPPYKHQANALESFFRDDQNLIVSTGTGSGKTEIFLYSILGQLAQEGQQNETASQRGIRTLLLYPMNALVADQLARLRQLLGAEDASETIKSHFGRRVQFGMYTGRTPYHGGFDGEKNHRRIRPIIEKYIELKQTQPDLYRELKEEGRVPAKNLEGFRNKQSNDRDKMYRTQPEDSELFTRQEMHADSNEHGGTPDLLITNYSMLEYMLLRPIEQPLFEDTREWLEADEENELTIVLDEAHLYRGAQGAEVSLLLSRLLQKLGITRDRVRFILTSATMGENVETAAPEFASKLTNSPQADFDVIQGKKITYPDGDSADRTNAKALEQLGYTIDKPGLKRIAEVRDWDWPIDDEKPLSVYVFEQLKEDPLFWSVHESLRDEPEELPELAEELFPTVEEDLAHEATGNLLYLCTEAKEEDDDDAQALLPTRLHMFLKGLPAQYACINPNCEGRRVKDEENKLLGRLYTTPKVSCDHCDSRVFELLSHRTCGAAYLRAYRQEGDTHPPTFLWTDPEDADNLDELHILVEEPRDDPDIHKDDHRSLYDKTPSHKLDTITGHLLNDRQLHDSDDDQYIEVWVPDEEPDQDDLAWSWTRCPACGIEEQRNRHTGKTKISDLTTKGEQPFANIVRSMFQIQPEDDDKDDLPNKGKKILSFSDGRQKAARLARDLQGHVEVDSFREVLADIVSQQSGELTMDKLFAEFVVYCKHNNILYFDNSDRRVTQNGVQYQGSRNHFQHILDGLSDIVERYSLNSITDIPDHPVGVQEVSTDRPRQYDELLLRSLGHDHFSIYAALVGYLKPTEQVLQDLSAKVDIDDAVLEDIIIEILRHASSELAYSEQIDPYRRKKALQYYYKDPNEQGIEFEDLVPSYLQDTLNEYGDDVWDQLKTAFVSTSPILFEPLQLGNYVINQEAVTLEVNFGDEWHICEGCNQFSVGYLGGNCSRENCGGSVRSINEDDIYLQARKGFLREPVRGVVEESRRPFTLRSEEHTAQLNAKDDSEAFARSEVYELLFQDILVGDNESEQPIDVLSCTTTMEVGIDIGSITGVAMRTVPPGPENYEQRAGRAGRRGVGLSTIVTFADNSPHESHYFNNPDEMIGEEGGEPVIYSENKKIAQRHINASLLAAFFDPSDIGSNESVFESLGTGAEFFDGDGDYTFEEFKDWLDTQVLVNNSSIVTEIEQLLPDGLEGSQGDPRRRQLIRETVQEFKLELATLNDTTDWSTGAEEEENLLHILINEALLPTFSFPTDVCSFIVKGLDDDGQPKTEYDTSRDLKQALSTYVPGRELVIDKKTYTSYGVYYTFTDDPVNRASAEEWSNLDWLNFCPECDTVYDETDRSMQANDLECTVCGNAEIKSHHQLTPPAFAPEIDSDDNSPIERQSYEEEHIRATPPKYPLTPTSQSQGEIASLDNTKRYEQATVGRLSDEQLLVANLGPSDDGFEICKDCGAVSRSGNLDSSHNRPYPKDIRRIQQVDHWPNTCSGETQTISFSHQFPSDLTLIRIPIKSPMEFAPQADWFDAAARSLAEALVMGAARALSIDRSELEGGFRTRAGEIAPSDDINGYIEIFLFDTTPGGAGFSSRAWEYFDLVESEARKILTKKCDCDSACHDCLRTYENRHLHGHLNRHYGAVLLDYAIKGTVPSLEAAYADSLMSTFEETLQLRDPDAAVTKTDEQLPCWKVTTEGTSQTIGVRSCLREPRESEASALDLDLSDYELTARLPDAARRLQD